MGIETCDLIEDPQCKKVWELKAPWDSRVIQGLRLYSSRGFRNLAEYLKVLVNEAALFLSDVPW
jgi:hypothetical protein